MPLYMDRHDLPGVTAEQIAQAHVLDVDVSARHGVRFLTYWFDPTTATAFCLAEAPSPEEMQSVHAESHGLIANQIIEVSEDGVLRFLGLIREPADQTDVVSARRTVMFTDLAGSTSILHRVGQGAFMDLLAEHDTLIRRALVAAEGREVKHTGDGVMASFDDVGRGLTCAAAIQDAFARRNDRTDGPPLLVRIGLAAGEPVDHNDDLFGSTVVLASRICQAAEPGRILVSDLVQELGEGLGFVFRSAGDRRLRGFPEPIAVFELASSGAGDGEQA